MGQVAFVARVYIQHNCHQVAFVKIVVEYVAIRVLRVQVQHGSLLKIPGAGRRGLKAPARVSTKPILAVSWRVGKRS
ncbi:MAG: hypothetical protein LH606_07055 [Cytophagaceae bacterium]|nr:hypothetical protein [Cytophagaceae bacterium]